MCNVNTANVTLFQKMCLELHCLQQIFWMIVQWLLTGPKHCPACTPEAPSKCPHVVAIGSIVMVHVDA